MNAGEPQEIVLTIGLTAQSVAGGSDAAGPAITPHLVAIVECLGRDLVRAFLKASQTASGSGA
jgi:hypothetical protein